MNIGNNKYKYGFHEPENYTFKSKKGLSKKVVEEISWMKKEPSWMRDFRLRSFEFFKKRPLPSWGGDLSKINFNDIYYYIRPTDKKAASWSELPSEIKRTYDRIGIPEAERKLLLGGVSAQYECLTGDSLVFGKSFITKIKDIKKGMNVYSLNTKTNQLEIQRVAGLLKKGKRKVFKVQVAGRTIKATENHPFLMIKYQKIHEKKRGKFSVKWEYLKNINKGDYIAVIKDFPDNGVPYKLPPISLEKGYQGKNQFGDFFVEANFLYTRRQKNLKLPVYTSKELLWIIGLYLGDGYISRVSKTTGRKILSFAIPKIQVHLQNKLTSNFKKVFGYKLSKKSEKYRIRIHSTPIIRFFEALRLTGKASSKKIPEWVFSLPRDQKLSLVGGYIDSDGYVNSNKKSCSVFITSINKDLLYTTQMLSLSCGLYATAIHKFKYKVGEKEKIGFRLRISGEFSILKEYSYKVEKSFQSRKYYHSHQSYFNKSSFKKYVSKTIGFVPVKKISFAGEEEVFDIEVEGYHNFVANGLIVHNSEVVYKSIQKTLSKKGVIFLDMDSGLREYPDLVRKYFGKIIPQNDNKFAALNSAVWSGGSFIYVPKGVHVDLPLQAYFRINAANMGQFERTLIIADEGSFVHYVEGCTAPIYTTDSLHSAVVEIIVHKGARVRYTTVQNWSNNVYNLVTKRMRVEEEAVGDWLDCNIGSKLTMKYPSCYLVGRRAHGEILSIAYAGDKQHQDAGGKAVHAADETTSRITSKSISKDGGRTSYRGFLGVGKNLKNIKSKVVCDALILDEKSRSDTYPTMDIREKDVQIEHEATVSKIGEEQLFYLQSRGLTTEEAEGMIVNGFIEPIIKELPLEYAVEMNRLIELKMEGSVG